VRKELPFLVGTLFLGSMLISPSESQGQSCEPPPDYEPGRVTNSIANLRVSSTTQSEILEVLGRESEIFVGEESEGQLVSLNGVSTNSWREVFYPETCESGFIWAGLIETLNSPEYDSLVFQSCPYYFVPDNITWMAFNYQTVNRPDEVTEQLQTWQGKESVAQLR